MENKETNIPVKSLFIGLIVLVLIVASLTSGPSVSKPELQVALVAQTIQPINGNQNSCVNDLNFSLVTPSTIGRDRTRVDTYRVTIVSGNLSHQYDVNINTHEARSLSANAPSINFVPIALQRNRTASAEFSARFIPGNYRVTISPKIGERVVTSASFALDARVASCPGGVPMPPAPTISVPVPFGVQDTSGNEPSGINTGSGGGDASGSL